MTATIRTQEGAEFARIMSVGVYRPERVVTNAEICTMIDSSDEWIQERSGIIERRFAALDESVVDMAEAAARNAIEAAGVDPSEVGMVLVATVTHPYQTPSASTEVAARIGAINAAAVPRTSSSSASRNSPTGSTPTTAARHSSSPMERGQS